MSAANTMVHGRNGYCVRPMCLRMALAGGHCAGHATTTTAVAPAPPIGDGWAAARRTREAARASGPPRTASVICPGCRAVVQYESVSGGVMTIEHDALWRLQRDLEAERRHVNPQRMRRGHAVQLLPTQASADTISELCDAVVGPSARSRRTT